MNTFEDDVREMRQWQKRFFKSAPSTPERKKALDISRLYEIRVDRALEATQQGQADLFAEAER